MTGQPIRRITHSIDLLEVDGVRERMHVARCSCGWRSGQYHMKSNLVMDLDWLHPDAPEQPFDDPGDGR